MLRRFTVPVLILFLLGICGYSHADTLDPCASDRIDLQPYMRVWEAPRHGMSAGEALQHSSDFVPLNELQPRDPTSEYWLLIPVNKPCDSARYVALTFAELTFTELFIFQRDSCILQRTAGKFRKGSEISRYDGRFFFTFPLQPLEGQQFLIRVHHTKHYQPQFNFELKTEASFRRDMILKFRIDFWLQGALLMFFLYNLISLLVTGFRPYLWLLIIIAGIGLNGVSLGGYLIDWFFDENPETGWLFNIHFLHLGIFGIYLLLIDFWQLPQKRPDLYKWLKVLIYVLLVVAVVSFLLDYFYSDYNLMNNINLASSTIAIAFVVFCCWECWPQLNRAQRFLVYGIIIIALGGLSLNIYSVLAHELSNLVAPYVTGITMLGMVILFSTGLKEELRQLEIEKHSAVRALAKLQQQQNVLLENQVERRTLELQSSNEKLIQQTHLLAERNERIETLINELNHRVKNNLQMLYSLTSLQLPQVKDEVARQALKANISRIRAMMLVNVQLFQHEDGARLKLKPFTTELCGHLKKIYDGNGMVNIEIEGDDDIVLDSDHAISFGLIITELLTNSFKHAFIEGSDGAGIRIAFSKEGSGSIRFFYSDNGKGIEPEQMTTSDSMGTSLIRDLTRQLNATLEINNQNGLNFMFLIPLK